MSGRSGSDYTGWGEPDGLVSDDLLPWLRWASGQIQ